MASRDATRKVPKVGDARVHRQRAVIFYVHEVQTNPGDPDDQIVCIATTPPGVKPVRNAQSVKAEEWYFKTDATCNRPICKGCAHRVGNLEYCGAHARNLTERPR